VVEESRENSTVRKKFKYSIGNQKDDVFSRHTDRFFISVSVKNQKKSKKNSLDLDT
jgi:hypothetical protein